jgi:hypothetical protein
MLEINNSYYLLKNTEQLSPDTSSVEPKKEVKEYTKPEQHGHIEWEPLD